jgi:hypothetical protein
MGCEAIIKSWVGNERRHTELASGMTKKKEREEYKPLFGNNIH